MENIVEIHQATKPELSQIASFLASAPVIHRHLDWRNTLEWLGNSPFLILSNSKEIQAILVAAPDPPGFAWIRCFAVGKNFSVDSAWSQLSANADTVLAAVNARMVAVGLQDWFSRMLAKHGFSIKQKIVVLEWNRHFIVPDQLQQPIFTRPMESADIPEVSEVDLLAFEPLWVNSQTSLQAAYLQSSHATVATLNNKIIAYELSTSAQFNAHLARLAVLPEFRRQAIGRVLVNEMLTYYAQQGIFRVTVNTQNDNLASLHLYKSVGFRPTFEEYPVLIK